MAPRSETNCEEAEEASALISWKCRFGISDAAVQALFDDVLPSLVAMDERSRLLPSHNRRDHLREAERLIGGSFNLGEVDIDCCVEGCMAFAGALERFQSCRFCEKSRCSANGSPQKSFRHLPFIPRLVAGFQCEKFRKNLLYGYQRSSEREAEQNPLVACEDFYDGHLRKTLSAAENLSHMMQFFLHPQMGSGYARAVPTQCGI